MDIWKAFEKRIQNESEAQGVTCVKVPEKIIISPKGSFRQKTQFDFCAGIDGCSAFFDAKSSAQDFYFKSHVTNPKKLHQYNALCSAGENQNIAGYLIWFYQEFKICWAPIDLVKGLIGQGVVKLTPDTEGLTVQMDNVPINLRTLLWEDRSKLMRKLCKA